MSDIKKINRQFIANLILLGLSIGIIVGLGVTGLILIENDDIKYVVAFIALILLMVVAIMFKNRTEQIVNLSYLIKIRHHSSEPLLTSQNTDKLEKTLLDLGYTKRLTKKAYNLFYRLSQDSVKKIFKKQMVEIVVISKGSTFYIDDVNKEVDKIHSELLKEKIKTDKLFITQIRDIDDLTEEVRKDIKEIVFLRSQRGIISVINIGIHLETRKAVMLYSDKYSPSLYYKYHIEQIKKLLKCEKPNK